MAASESPGMKKLCEWYIRRIRIIGFLYCAAPTLVWFAILFATSAFREVYLLRLGLALVAGGALAAWVNQFGVSLWLAKHRSAEGPATVLDGALIGVGTGWGSALVPPLTTLISSTDLEYAKTFIIASWLAAAALGLIFGAVLASVGRRQLDRGPAAAAGGRPA